MRINIIIKGRSWLFQLANSFNKTNNLEKLVTTYPKFYTQKFNIPNKKVNSVIILFVIEKFLAKFINPLLKKLKINFDPMVFIDWLSDLIFSLFYVKNVDYLLVGFGASACRIIKKAKKKNIKTIYFLNTTCQKSKYQKLVENEFIRLGMKNYYYREPESLTNRIHKSIEMADYVGALSTSQKNSFVEAGFDKSKMFLNLMGVDTSLFFPNKRKKREKFIVLTNCNNFVRKGIKYLIEAFNQLNLKNAELWISGINDEEQIKKIVKINNKIVFKKRLTHENDLPGLYNQADIFCLPSFEEGLPNVVCQAMSCGLPIISTEFVSDIVSDNIEGFVIQPGKSKELAEKIKFFYDNPQKTLEMGINSRRKAENLLSYDKIAERILKFCNNEDDFKKI